MASKKYVPVMVTPFQQDKTIDYKMLGELVDFYLDAGAGGLFANCLSSEMFQLSPEEMLESVRFVVEKAQGRVPVVASGSFGADIEEQAGFIRKISTTGITSVIVITGLLATEEESDEVFQSRVWKLLDLTDDIPLGFYECPVPYKRLVDPGFLSELVATGRVKYHKDTCLDIEGVRKKLEGSGSNPSFGLYDAYMVHAVESLKAGSAGLSCIQGNYFPELVAWLCDHYLEDSPEVAAVQQFFADNMDVMHDTYPASSKYILRKRGLNINLVCRNGSSLKGEADRKALDDLLENYHTLAEHIGLQLVNG